MDKLKDCLGGKEIQKEYDKLAAGVLKVHKIVSSNKNNIGRPSLRMKLLHVLKGLKWYYCKFNLNGFNNSMKFYSNVIN